MTASPAHRPDEPQRMNAAFILDALRAKYPDAAILPEVVIHAEEWDEHVPDGGRTVHVRRIDALMFDGPQRTAIEVKVSRADFARDTYRKRRPWMLTTHRFIYVTPAGLDVMAPHPCGHWEVHEDGSVTVKKRAYGNKYPEPLPQHVVTAIAHRAAMNGATR